MYGHSKWSRKKRIDWFNKNIEEIQATFKNDFNQFNIKFGRFAKEPAQFIACLMEYIQFLDHKSQYKIKTPILFDATCSGVQHLSALSKDTHIAKLVNLLENDVPSDFYQYCIDQILDIIKNKSLSEEHKILKFKLEKKDVYFERLKNSNWNTPSSNFSYLMNKP